MFGELPGCEAPAGTYPAAGSSQLDFFANCSAVPAFPGAGAPVSGGCAGRYDLVRRLQTTGAGGLVTVVVQTLHVDDVEAPTFNFGANQTVVVECGVDGFPGLPSVTAQDSCDTRPSSALIQDDVCVENTTGTCVPEFFQTRTWKAVDSCGNSNCFTQTVVHRDTRGADHLRDRTSPTSGFKVP